ALLRRRYRQHPAHAHRDTHANTLEPDAPNSSLTLPQSPQWRVLRRQISLFQSVDLRQSLSMLRNRLLWCSALPVLLIAVASWSFSFALQAGWLRRSLSARLTATFGRPVEVAHFGFTILGGPQFEADSVTVSEDPRFGQEYFLRADRLTARLRLAALLHGRLEFDRLSLSRPS